MKKEYIKHAWSVLCQNSSTDQTSNTLSLFNIFEEMTIDLSIDFDKQLVNKEYTVLAIPFQLVSLWNRSTIYNEELVGDVKVVLKDPKNNIVQEFAYKLTIPADKRRMRFSFNMNGIKINLNKGGDYLFEVSVKGPDQIDFQRVAEIPLYVAINKPKS